MSEEFDPYQQWLGISPRERPVDHYRLLGLAHFEGNPAIIAQAADERMTMVRSYQTGPRGAHTQKLLNDISTARLCLLNADTKSMYDAALQGRFAAAAAPHAASLLPPSAAPPHTAPMALPFSAAGFGGIPAPVAVRTTANTRPTMPVGNFSALPPPVPPPVRPTFPPLPHVAAGPAQRDATYADDDTLENSPPVTRGRIFGALVLVAAISGVWVYIARPFGKASNSDSTATTDATADAVSDTDSSTDAETPPRKPNDEPVLIEQEGSGQINFPASLAQIHGDSPQVEVRGDDILITNWTSADDWLSWRFHISQPGIFRVYIQYLAPQDADGGHFELTLDEETKTGDVRVSEGDKFNTENLFFAVKRGGAHSVTLKPSAKPGAEFMTLKTIRFEPQ